MGGKSGGSANPVTGYRYYFDILMGLFRGPIDQLVAIRVGDIEVWPSLPDGSHPSSSAEYLAGLFTPGSPGPPGGFYDASGGVVNTSAKFAIVKPEVFGGDKGEGGIVGNVTMMMGDANQQITDEIRASIAKGNSGFYYTYPDGGGVGVDNSGLDAQGKVALNPETGLPLYGNDGGTGSTVERATDISDFRGVATMFYSGAVCSNNPYPKVWKMRGRRALAGWQGGCWYPDKAAIVVGDVHGMNGAHIIYQALTDKTWGRGMERDELDEPSFIYAANRLFDESFGLNLKWSKETDIMSFIQIVIEHISAVLQIDRLTGLMRINLIRDDYDPTLVPLFDYNSGLLEVASGDTGAASVMINEIIVKWHDPILDQDRQLRTQNLASQQSLGYTIPETKDYPGIGNSDLAARVALRDLQVHSGVLKRFKLKLDRRAWKLSPGSVFKIAAQDKGITQTILRVATYDDGNGIDGTINIEAVQDVFGMPSTIYMQDPVSTWVGPDSTQAAPPKNQTAYEASYYDMIRGLSPQQIAQVTPTDGGIIVLGGKGTANTVSGVVSASVPGSATTIVGTGTLAPTATIQTAMDCYTTVIQLKGGSDLRTVAVGQSAVLENNEIVRIDAFDIQLGIVTIGRGCADTIPKPHVAGSVIYFTDATKVIATPAYAVGETVSVSLLTKTQRDTLDPAQAATSTVTITGRWAKPYPPGLVTINGLKALRPEGDFISGDVNIAWASRNKILQADQLIDFTEASITPEVGTTYTVQVWDHVAGTLIREHTGLTGNNFMYGDAEWDAHNDPIELDLKLFSVLGSLASMDTYDIRVSHVDAGAGSYGNAYGYFYSEPPAYGHVYGYYYGQL